MQVGNMVNGDGSGHWLRWWRTCVCRIIGAVLLCVVSPGCGESVDDVSGSAESGWAPEPATSSGADEPFENRMVTADEMRSLLGANEQASFERSGRNFSAAILANSGAKTLEPLSGQPLKVLDISRTKISDLSPLVGMPLEKLAMLDSGVQEIASLEGMPLEFLDASRTGVSDLTPAASLVRLTHLYLEGAKVSDVTPLAGLSLKVLWLNECPVSDLSSLEGKHFEELNLCDTQIADLASVSTMKLGTLWIRGTPVVDLSPLAAVSLTSLDIQGTSVSDLSPLEKMTALQRLNISKTRVSDLTPLAGLSLTRLIFTPQSITRGLDVIRQMDSLRELDVQFEGNAPAMSPSEFWEQYDAGAFKPETE